ncbi:ABC transporter permease [Flavisolibacter nicotianae]|uniref:ABC transporter permease n=1 Tax=Flavisolibacter nicotianae TaxID=2364882 RepID=UPI000EB55E46|nr:ABC transporter permease [Flavisolibacter nicotianae]
MFFHNLKIAFRNLAKQKVLSFINISGLSIGLGCFVLFLLFAVHEFTYDRFHQNAANIYRVAEWIQTPERQGGDAFGGTPLGPAIKADFSDVKAYARIQAGFDDKFVRVNNDVTRSKISFADPQLFKMFSFKTIAGDAFTALNDKQTVVLTKEKAIQLFGRTDVVGSRVDIKMGEQYEPFVVGAVTEDIPSNSSIRYSILGSYAYLMASDMGRQSDGNWHMTIGSETYLLLDSKSNLAQDAGRLAQFRRSHMPGEEEELKKMGVWDGKGPFPVRFLLQPLKDVHTNPAIGGPSDTIDPKIIWILIAIASAILIIACINFTTIAIGRSSARAKEVGIKKVTGSRRGQLIGQFLTESILLSVFAVILGCVLAMLLLPFFNQLAGRELHFSFSQFPQLLWLLLALTLLTGLFAGIYPAFVLSSFRPIEAIKNKIRLGGSNLFTKSLVSFQFVLSIVLIISTLVLLQQLKFLRTQNIGFQKENVLVVDADGTDAKKIYPLFRQMVLSNTAFAGISASEMGMGEGKGLMGTGFQYEGETKGVIMYPVDAGFLKTMKMQLLAGRDFNPELTTDTVDAIIANEALLKDFGLTLSTAVGAELKERRFGDQLISRRIIGVVRNFNYASLKQEVRPQMFFQPPQLQPTKFYIRLRSGDPSTALAFLQAAWKKLAPEFPLRYSFLDEDMNRFYVFEERWSRVAGWAGGICIFLACLGLFGLAALTAVNRTKEIGIRKVLGASVSSIVTLLSKDFLKLVLIAFVIASPLAWLLMHKFLQEYAYRISIGWWVFILTGVVALLVAFVTIGSQALKSAVANPAKNLRTE